MFHRSALGRDPRHHCPSQIPSDRSRTFLGWFLGCGLRQISRHVLRPRGLAGFAVARARAKMVATGKYSSPSAGWQWCHSSPLQYLYHVHA
eukprot:7699359-Pyramimonas_sp.AAC.1